MASKLSNRSGMGKNTLWGKKLMRVRKINRFLSLEEDGKSKKMTLGLS